jgi:hypothetical protein
MDFYSEKFTCEPRLLLGLARIHESLRDDNKAIECYKQVNLTLNLTLNLTSYFTQITIYHHGF